MSAHFRHSRPPTFILTPPSQPQISSHDTSTTLFEINLLLFSVAILITFFYWLSWSLISYINFNQDGNNQFSQMKYAKANDEKTKRKSSFIQGTGLRLGQAIKGFLYRLSNMIRGVYEEDSVVRARLLEETSGKWYHGMKSGYRQRERFFGAGTNDGSSGTIVVHRDDCEGGFGSQSRRRSG